MGAVHDFIDRCLASADPNKEWLPDVHVVADEMASNIEKYAYGGGPGRYLVWIGVAIGCLELRFEDSGMEFDPTMIDEVPIDGQHDRPVGKLGILLVKKLAAGMSYSRRDGKNLTVVAMRVPLKNNLQRDDE